MKSTVILYSKGSVQINICSYFVSARHGGEGGGGGSFFFVSRVFKNEQMFQFQNFDFLSKKSVSTYFLFLKPR